MKRSLKQRMNKTLKEKPLTQRDTTFLVQRRFHILQPTQNASQEKLKAVLEPMPGVIDIRISDPVKVIVIEYDMRLVSFDELSSAIQQVGYEMSAFWWYRLLSTFYNYLDETAMENTSSKTSSCCSNPSDIYASKHK